MTDEELKKAIGNAYRAGNMEAASRIASMLKKQQAPKPTASDKASAIGQSALSGLADPLYGVSQMISHAGEYATSLGGNYKNPVSDYFGQEAALYGNLIKEQDKRVEQARENAGFDGFDIARLGGNIINPINALPAAGIAGKLGQGASLASTALRTAGAGAFGGMTAPVSNTDNYAGEKLSQIGLGAAGGAVLGTATNKLGGLIGSGVNRAKAMLNKPSADDVIMDALGKAGVELDDISSRQMQAMRQQVSAALNSGKQLDPAAVLRKGDADALGIRLSKGQVTRNPMQFAREKNLRGIDDVGEELTNLYDSQDFRISQLLNEGAKDALDPDVAGQKMIGRLKSVDDQMQSRVSGLYKAARDSAGAKTDVPMTGLADDIATIADEFEGQIPKGLLNRFKKYGLYSDKIDDPAKQTKVFDMVEAEKMLKAVNEYGDATSQSVTTGLNRLRDALKRAITEGADDGGPFAFPRKAASERFKLQDSVKALKDVSEGKASPDKFFDKYVLRAEPREVKQLAQLMDDPTRNQVRAQINERLRNAGLGTNLAGDKKLAAERYANELRKIGNTRLNSFFSEDEVADMKRIARVGAYIVSPPGNAAVNFSNTGSAVSNGPIGEALKLTPGFRALSNVARRYADAKDARAAMDSNVAAISPLISSIGNRRLGPLTAGASLVGSPLLFGAD